MKKSVAVPIVLCLMLSLIILQGCTSNKAYVKRDPALISPLKCIRYETPSIQKKTAGESLLIGAAVIVAPGGPAIYLMGEEYAKLRGKDIQNIIPDFGSLVIDKFGEKITRETEEFPDLTVVNPPVQDDYADTCTLIEFKVKKLTYGYLGPWNGKGFLSDTVASMKDKTGEVLWQKDFTYMSKDFERDREMEEFEADEGKLLKEEFEFAAEKTATDFYQDLTGKKM